MEEQGYQNPVYKPTDEEAKDKADALAYGFDPNIETAPNSEPWESWRCPVP
jgi:hypothetical protein